MRNESALEFVIDEFGWIINSVLSKELMNYPDLKDECFNDTLLFIWNHIESYDESKGDFTTWIGIVSKYRAIDAKRSLLKKVSNEIYLEEDFLLKSGDSPSEKVLEEEIINDLKKFLSNLGDDNKEIFWKYYVEEYGIDEISKKFNISRQAIYNRLFRSKQKLRKSFKVYLNEKKDTF